MTNLLLTVTLFVGTTTVWKTTNAISADWHEPDCCLVRYMEGGKTNEFHAWTAGIATVDIRPNRKKGLRKQ